MLPRLNRQNQPPHPGPPMLIRRVKKNQTITVTFLCRSVWGLWTHWAGNRSEPCFEDKKDCPGHKRGLPLRWKGYYHVFNHDSRAEEFLEVTPVIADYVNSLLGKDEPLRGNRANVSRGASDNSRMRVNLLTRTAKLDQLPPEKDPMAVLMNLWGLDLKSINGNPPATLPLGGVG
jgi:hypothetical protein